MSQNTITVTTVPGTSQAIFLDDGATLGQALSQAGVSTDGQRVAVNGTATTNFDQPVVHGDRVTVARQVKGN